MWSISREMRGRLPLLAFGVSLARRGVLSVLSIVICALTAVGLGILAIVLAVNSDHPLVYDVPLIASGALAWGGGFLHAFGSAAHALRKDRESGVRELVVTRTASLEGYLFARVGGLAMLLAITVGGGTLFASVVSIFSAIGTGTVGRTFHTTIAALAFSLAFSAVIAPLAYAAVGARSRVGGYLFLIGVVVVPEIVASGLSHVLPHALTEVLSIPSALSALRSALADDFDFLRAIRALVALAAFTALATLLVRREAIVIEEVPA